MTFFRPRKLIAFLVLIIGFLCAWILYFNISDQPRVQSVYMSALSAAASNTGRRPTFQNKQLESELTKLLLERLSLFPTRTKKAPPSCTTLPRSKLYNTACVDPECPPLDPSPEVRLQQILATRVELLPEYLSLKETLAQNVPRAKYIFLTAASSNHYREMQALVYNLATLVFPRLNVSDFVFVLFDLGLTPDERKLTERNCQCRVLDFPFDKFPLNFRILKCFQWKTFIITSLIEKSEFLIWMDTSVRWKKNASLETVFRRAAQQGIQCNTGGGSIAIRTSASTFGFFGDQACQYSQFREIESNLEVYHNQRFVKEVLFQPWLACIFNDTCMCVKDYPEKLLRCSRPTVHRYSLCHRTQSTLGIMLTKLYLEKWPLVKLPHDIASIRRKDEMNWFH